jgi:putative tricarboxylic transport membrane protein
MFDVWVLVVFGLLGYVMRKTDFPTAPLVLAFVLGPLFEQAVRRSLVISQGDPSIFITRPWAVVFLIVTVLLTLGPVVWSRIRRRRDEAPEGPAGGPEPAQDEEGRKVMDGMEHDVEPTKTKTGKKEGV